MGISGMMDENAAFHSSPLTRATRSKGLMVHADPVHCSYVGGEPSHFPVSITLDHAHCYIEEPLGSSESVLKYYNTVFPILSGRDFPGVRPNFAVS